MMKGARAGSAVCHRRVAEYALQVMALAKGIEETIQRLREPASAA
jgi:hypothetical protein